jgi:hypothetical protein
MQRTVSSMIFTRVLSPRLRGALVRLVGATDPIDFIVDFIT